MDEKNFTGGSPRPSQNVPNPPPVVPGMGTSVVPPVPPVQSVPAQPNPIVNQPQPPSSMPSSLPPSPPPLPQAAPTAPPPTPPAPGSSRPSIADLKDRFSINKKVLGIFGVVSLVVIILIFLVAFILPLFQNQSAKNVTLTYWGLWEDVNVVQPLIDEFQKENPNIKVNYSKQDIKQYRERLSTRIENGTGPDVFKFHNTWTPVLANSILPLPTNVISKEEFNNYYPVVQKDLTRNGAVYGIAMGIDTLVLYINKDILQTAGAAIPTNWNDFINVSKSLTVKDDTEKIVTSGAALGTYDNVKHAPDIISLLLVQNGANLNDLQSTPQNSSDAIKFYTSFTLDEGKVWDATLDPSLVAFSKGELAMYFGYSWDYFSIKAANPSLNVEIVSVPQLPDQEVNIASYWADGVSVKSKNQEEALSFIKFLSKKESAQKLFAEQSKVRAFGTPYARADLEDLISGNTLLAPFVKQAKTATSSFFADDTFDNALNSQMNTYLGNTIRSITNDSASPETAIQTLSEGVTQVLSQYD